MRDIILAGFILGALPFVLWRPSIGVFLWVWVSVMTPHRLTWGFAWDMRWGYYIAVATLAGLLFARVPKRLPVTPVTIVFSLFVLWITVTTFFAFDFYTSMGMWKEVIKIMLMVFVALALLHSKQHVQVLIWILAGSVAFYGVKGGLFTLRESGELRVYGPIGSFIEENNALALATIMTIPLLYYLFLQDIKQWVRWGLVATVVRWSLVPAMAICGVSALGSHSRGAFLAIAAMLGFLWLKSRSKAATGLVLILLIPVVIGFMPDKWTERMWTIQNYKQDGSAMGRINAWDTAFNVAADRPFGVGFVMANASVFARYSPIPADVMAPHSIYFQVLGEHGFVGLALFLLFWILVWRDASWIIRQCRNQKELLWASDLARMIQVSLVGYFVGGAFLSLAYYDVPYNLMVALVLTRLMVGKAIKSVDMTQEAPMRSPLNAGEARMQQSLESPNQLAGRRR
ncbi:MAG TPA: putative O-glycosylation ligase, exosortase A system-associated [Burkholderiales bacterium]|nr:putative O-glycosylation ligase, exosortase A system-associated [Burkholderiales bacterium]